MRGIALARPSRISEVTAPSPKPGSLLRTLGGQGHSAMHGSAAVKWCPNQGTGAEKGLGDSHLIEELNIDETNPIARSV